MIFFFTRVIKFGLLFRKYQKSSNLNTAVAETPKPKAEIKKAVQLSYKEKREYEELEAKIPKLEEEKR